MSNSLRGHVNVDLNPILGQGTRPGKILAGVVLLMDDWSVVSVILFYAYENWLFAWNRAGVPKTVWAT